MIAALRNIPNPLSLIGTKVYLVVIGVLIAAVGVQQVRVANAHADLAQEKQAHSDANAARSEAALRYATAIAKLTADHAKAQAEKETENAKKYAKLEADRRAGAATVGRLRDQLAAYTAGDRRPGETDAAAAERYADRLGTVGGLLGEGIGLVEEGRAIIARRDLEVANLLQQIQIDRAACSAESVK